jgi:hypothetical protein
MSTEDGAKIKNEQQLLLDDSSVFKPTKWKWYEWPEIIWLRYIVRPWEDACMYTKRFFQRGFRGYGDCDLWGMHSFLTETILNMLVHLRQIKHGYPATKDENGNCGYDEARWDRILNEMIEGFAILRKCDTCDEMIEWGGYSTKDPERDVFERKMQEKYPRWRFTTPEEEAKVKRAFELLQEHYFGLWD